MNKYNLIEEYDDLYSEEYTSSKRTYDIIKNTPTKILSSAAAGLMICTPTLHYANVVSNDKLRNVLIQYMGKKNNSIVNISEFKNDLQHETKTFFEYIHKVRSSIPVFDQYKVIKEIISFKTLKNNWDGMGAYPLEVLSAQNAIELLSKTSSLLHKLDDFFPNPNGTISFLWGNSNSERLSIEIGNTSFSYYVDLIEQDVRFFNNVDFNDEEIYKLVEYISFL